MFQPLSTQFPSAPLRDLRGRGKAPGHIIGRRSTVSNTLMLTLRAETGDIDGPMTVRDAVSMLVRLYDSAVPYIDAAPEVTEVGAYPAKLIGAIRGQGEDRLITQNSERP